MNGETVKRERKKEKVWRIDHIGVRTCESHTKSEARAMFKKMLGIPGVGRLPAHVTVSLVHDPNLKATQTGAKVQAMTYASIREQHLAKVGTTYWASQTTLEQIHARAMVAVAGEKADWKSMHPTARHNVKWLIKRDVQQQYGFIWGPILSFVISKVVELLMAWIMEQFASRTFTYNAECYDTLTKLAAEAQETLA